MKVFFSKFANMAAAAVAAFIGFSPFQAQAQVDPYLGQITYFPYSYCPRGWSETHGQLLPIAQYSALFALLGTNYGGDGRTTFGLPDLRGRVAIGEGAGPGIGTKVLGQKGGRESVSLTANELPSHNHIARAVNRNTAAGGGYGDAQGPGEDLLATPDVNDPNNPGSPIRIYSNISTPNIDMNQNMISFTGNSAPFNISNPYLALRPCIALQGVFPPRN